MHVGATSLEMVHSKVTVLTPTGFGWHGAMKSKECLNRKTGQTMFFKGSANKGIHLKTCVRMASPRCRLRPEAHREVFQVYISCIERYKPLDLFSVPFFSLSFCPSVPQSWRWESRREKAGVRQETYREACLLQCTSPRWLMRFASLSVYTGGKWAELWMRPASLGAAKAQHRPCSAPPPLTSRPSLASQSSRHAGVSRVHMLVASCKFSWSKQSGPVSSTKA